MPSGVAKAPFFSSLSIVLEKLRRPRDVLEV